VYVHVHWKGLVFYIWIWVRFHFSQSDLQHIRLVRHVGVIILVSLNAFTQCCTVHDIHILCVCVCVCVCVIQVVWVTLSFTFVFVALVVGLEGVTLTPPTVTMEPLSS
jgi:ABC-type transport system involved in cytochrome c biogenesis permease subunit